jgi:LysM repeat protein
VSGGSAHAATTPQWDAIARCESNDDWSINYSSDGLSVGGLQFQNPSWKTALAYLEKNGHDTSGWTQSLYQGMPRSQVPTKEQTILAAEALLAVQGPGAWVCKGQGLSPSMFQGGPKPDILGGKPRKVKPVPVPTSKSGKHTVASGDTLYDIAKVHTGNSASNNWESLYEKNKSVIGQNPDLILPGQVFELPYGEAPPPAPPAVVKSGHVAPLKAPITQNYGNSNARYTLGYHTGVDFGAGNGTPVYSVANGVVVASDDAPAYGINVKVKHDDGTYGFYAHLSGKLVSPGKRVTAGQFIGKVGNTGHGTGYHLHFEIRRVANFGEGNFLEPVQWLKSHGVKL